MQRAHAYFFTNAKIAEDGAIYSTEGASTKAGISEDGGVDVESEITITPMTLVSWRIVRTCMRMKPAPDY